METDEAAENIYMVHTYLEVFSAGLQSSDVCTLFIQSPQSLNSEVLSFTKYPKFMFYSFNFHHFPALR